MKIDKIPFNEIDFLVITHKKCFFIILCCHWLPILMSNSSEFHDVFEQNLLLATQIGAKDLTVNTKFLMFIKKFCLNDITASIFKIVTIVPLYRYINLCQKLSFLEKLLFTYINCKYWMSETISVHNMFSPGLSLELSYIEFVIHWTVSCHIVG